MEDTGNKFCSILFDVLLHKGVRNVVCSPGSRNVPLLLAAAGRPMMHKYFAVDERSAGFMALGMSTVNQEPVAIVCTSGTALLNYSPAVAEAYYQGIPLIVISADRPIQWIDQDDSQTLRQDDILFNFVKKSYSIPALGQDEKEMHWFVNRITNDAVLTATSGKPGPVHINIHLGETLSQTCKHTEETPRTIQAITGDSIVNKELIKELAHRLADSKVMFVAGFSLPDSYIQKAVADFCRFPNVAVMAETISNLHLKNLDYAVDTVLTSYTADELDRISPDIVVTMGGALVSRKLKEYLRRNSYKCQHWAIGYSNSLSDPFMSMTLKIEVEPSRFFRNLCSAMRKQKISKKAEDYKEIWQEKRIAALQLKEKFIASSKWSELKAFDYILKNLPGDYNLFLSNGTAVRYAQIIRYPLPHASYCNRGVSGIDGSVSTAIGGALAFKGKSVLITGDLSLAYDIGALGLKDIPERFKIIVMDNQGGGIFRFIPSTSKLQLREEYLCQAPVLPLENLAAGYGWDYFYADSEEKLESIFKKFVTNPRKAILKVSCSGILSAEILKNYMDISVSPEGEI